MTGSPRTEFGIPQDEVYFVVRPSWSAGNDYIKAFLSEEKAWGFALQLRKDKSDDDYTVWSYPLEASA